METARGSENFFRRKVNNEDKRRGGAPDDKQYGCMVVAPRCNMQDGSCCKFFSANRRNFTYVVLADGHTNGWDVVCVLLQTSFRHQYTLPRPAAAKFCCRRAGTQCRRIVAMAVRNFTATECVVMCVLTQLFVATATILQCSISALPVPYRCRTGAAPVRHLTKDFDRKELLQLVKKMSGTGM